LASEADPVSVSTPDVAFQDPVMPLASEKARTSSADWKPEEIATDADSMLTSSASTSVMVRL